MTCPHCEPWAARTLAQAKNRKANLALGGDVYACPKCGTRDWAMSESKIDDRAEIRERKRTRGLLFGALIILMMVIVFALSRG